MKLFELYPWMPALGWSLVHSLWQGLALVILWKIAHKVFPRASAAVRYISSATILLVMLLLPLITFITLSSDDLPEVTEVMTSSVRYETGSGFTTATASISMWRIIFEFINTHVDLILLIWISGMLVFSLRLWSGWWASARLYRKADEVTGFWKNQIYLLTQQLGISSEVMLAQTCAVSSPVVMGFFKPIILLPVGMLSGLTTEQIETVLLHELAHIRRHDYLLNIFQLVMEAVFFFNPFVWIVSARMRMEREECCDDVVVKLRNPLVYARALHHLESERQLHSAVALAATGNQNQLLQRIKRFMEQTEKKEQGNRKFVPALVMMFILVSASWISVQAYQPSAAMDRATDDETLDADTVIKDKKTTSHVYQSVTTYDKKGNPHTVIHQSSSDDDALHPIEAIPAIAPLPAMTPMAPLAPMTAFAEMDALPEIPPVPAFNFSYGDTLLPLSNGNWDEFSRQFTQEFQQKFGDFYAKNGPEFQKMMKEMEIRMENMQFKLSEFNRFEIDQQVQRQLERAHEMAERAYGRNEERRELSERDRQRSDDGLVRLDQSRHESEVTLEQAERNREESMRQLESMQDDMTSLTNDMGNALRSDLEQDHYISKGETITSLQWNENGLKVNGKEVKERDKAKYKKLMKKFESDHDGDKVKVKSKDKRYKLKAE